MFLAKVKGRYQRDGIQGLVKNARRRALSKLRDNFPKFNMVSHPLERVFIEVSAFCNLRCEACLRNNCGRELEGFMELDLYRHIIDELASIGDVSIFLYLAGETLLHPDLDKIIKYAMSKRKFLGSVGLATNGMLLNERNAKLLVDSHVDWVEVSVDAVGELGEKLRKGSRYDVIETNLRRFLEIRNASPKRLPYVSIGTILFTQTDSDLQALFNAWADKIDYFHVGAPCDAQCKRWNMERILSTPMLRLYYVLEKKCRWPFQQLVILWNGDVQVCNSDFRGLGVFGNVKKSSIRQLWDSPEIVATRQSFSRGLCAECLKFSRNTYYKDSLVGIMRQCK